MDSGVAGKMSTNGKYLVCGSLTNTSMVTAKGGIEYIDSDTFDKLLTSSTVTFNANGGSVSDTLKTVYYGQCYGALPTPVHANYTFIGWYTSSDGGNLITAETLVSSLVNITLYAHWTPNSFNVYFDANGGTVSVSSKSATFGNSLGALPTPNKANYDFTGWFTSDGRSINASFVPDSATNITLYAQWSPKSFSVIFDANGGTVSVSSKSITFGNSLGTLPTPTRDYYNFTGWCDASGNSVSASTVPSSATNITLYAQWTLKPVSSWVKLADMPLGAQVIDTKWTYTLREYTTNAASTLSGWIKYDTQRTSWGEWSSWSTSNPSNGVRNVESRTEYHYYRWINSSGYVYTDQHNSNYWLEEKWFTYELPVYDNGSQGTSICVDGSGYKNRWVRADYEYNRSVSKTFTRTTYRYQDPVYTYYYYRDLSLETTSDPTGGANISGVVKWVKYRAK